MPTTPRLPVFLKDAQSRWSTHFRHQLDAEEAASAATGLIWTVLDNHIPHVVSADKGIVANFCRGDDGAIRARPGFATPHASKEFSALEIEPTPVAVIFRKDKDGVFALVPEVPATQQHRHVTCYTQHGHTAADARHCIDKSEPATPEEYAGFAIQMQRVGYNVAPAMRVTVAMDQKRFAALQAIEKPASALGEPALAGAAQTNGQDYRDR